MPATAKQQQRRRRWIIVGSSVLIIILVIVLWLLRPRPVAVVRPQVVNTVESLTGSGNVTGAQDSQLAPQMTGVLAAVLVSEGQQVQRGQLVARLDDGVLRAQVRQAEAALKTTQAQVVQASSSARQVDAQVRQAQAEVAGATRQASAQLAQAQARLRELQAGGTMEERAAAVTVVRQAQAQVGQAELDLQQASTLAETNATARAPLEQAQAAFVQAQASVRRAQTTLAQAERDLARAQILYEQQAIARTRLESAQLAVDTAREDVRLAIAQQQQARVEVNRQTSLLATTREAEVQRAQTALAVAQQNLQAAQVRLQQVSGPARMEEIAQQQAAVATAEANLAAAQQAGQERINALRQTPAAAQILVAREQAAQAADALNVARAQAQNALVTAPYQATVTEILAHPGDSVGPGQPILRLAQMSAPQVLVDFDERDLPQLAPGQRAVLIADAYPDQPFYGYVQRIGAQTDPQRGTVQVTILPTTVPDWLRDGMTVDATVILRQTAPRLVVPASTIMRDGDRTAVFVVVNGRVRRRTVQAGPGDLAGVIINRGLTTRDLVALNPQGVHEGERVSPHVSGKGGR